MVQTPTPNFLRTQKSPLYSPDLNLMIYSEISSKRIVYFSKLHIDMSPYFYTPLISKLIFISKVIREFIN